MAWYLLTGETATEILSDAGFTILIGLVVVFLVLLLLTVIFKMFGVVMGSSGKKESADEVASTAPAPAAAPAPAPVADLGPMVSSAQVRNGITDEETAVIVAAVAATLPTGTAYTIRKIDRAD